MKLLKINQIHPNPKNPRIIRDEKFKKLVKSLQDFPEMMSIRPVVCNTELMILGGNMRFEAAKVAGWREVPVEIVDLSEEKQAEFIIKDNVSGGEWDYDELANNWEAAKLDEWGVGIPFSGLDANQITDEDVDLTEDFDPIGESKDIQRVVFMFENSDQAELYLNKNKIKFEKRNMAWQVNIDSRFI